MLIDRSYFIGELNIAQLGQRTVQIRLDIIIGKREPEYLKAVLGYELYKAFSEGLEEDDIDEKWTDLRDGCDYEDTDGNQYRWEGFTNEALLSPIANYVYYWYTRDNASNTTASGEKEDSGPGSINVAPALKQARAWNEMAAWNAQLYHFLQNKKVDDELVYPEYESCNTNHDVYHTINVYNL